MTVCIAAICEFENQKMIVGASDRMLTAGDIEFEPPQTKTFVFRNNIVALVAGESSAQITICNNSSNEVLANQVIDVKAVAAIYAKHFASYRRERAERTILVPLGLTLDTFLNRHREIPFEVYSRLSRELQHYELGVETIIAGVDITGAHIYVVDDPGVAACNDPVGFASIGAGQWHAQSQFMFAGYMNRWPFPRALFLTYAAKKRAEVAPGVGRATDFFLIATDYRPILEPHLSELERIYQNSIEQEKTIIDSAYERVENQVRKLRGNIAHRNPPFFSVSNRGQGKCFVR